jgi:hypothetical protein
MGRFTASAASLLSLALVGCSTVPLGDPARSAELKKFEVKQDVGQVYICRGDGHRNESRLSVELDGKPMGRLLGNTFAYREVTPGNHEAVATSHEHDSKIPFSIAAGEQRFFRAWFTAGIIFMWAFLEDLDVATGKACVEAGNLAAPPPVK